LEGGGKSGSLEVSIVDQDQAGMSENRQHRDELYLVTFQLEEE
jgi:hypothetical protein